MLVTADKSLQLFGYRLDRDVVNYKLAVLQRRFDEAEEIYRGMDPARQGGLARFLDKIGHKETALRVATDDNHRFTLALGLGKLELAAEIAAKGGDGQSKMWRQLGDSAMAQGNLELAGSCFKHAKDFNSCLLLFSSTGDRKNLAWTADQASAAGAANVAWQCLHILNRPSDVVDCFLAHDRVPQAAFYARTYAPDRVADVLPAWRELQQASE